jgi:hypothetical protein
MVRTGAPARDKEEDNGDDEEEENDDADDDAATAISFEPGDYSHMEGDDAHDPDHEEGSPSPVAHPEEGATGVASAAPASSTNVVVPPKRRAFLFAM